MSTAKVIKPITITDDGGFSRASTKRYYDANGVLQTAAIDEPCLNHDPVTGSVELLFEDAATNLLTYSEQFDNAVWDKARGSITPNSVSAPDGTMTADKFIQDTQTGTHGPYRATVSYTGGVAYTASIFAKAEAVTQLCIQLDGTTPFAGANKTAYFDLVGGAVISAAAGVTADMLSCGGGWFRCYITVTPSATGTGRALFVQAASGSQNIVGDGASGFYIWGAQLEVGSSATSYIPTTSAPVTRAADIWTGELISSVAENDYPAFDAATNYAIGDRVLYATTHKNYELSASPAKTVTISIATPALVTSVGHAHVADTPVVFSTTGALPTGLTAGTTYYVKSPTADAYQLAATAGGAAINTSGTQSGTHTATARPLPTNSDYWLDLGATNRWAMFDNVVGTATTDTSPVTVVMQPGSVSGLGMLELVGRSAQITMKDGAGGTTVYSRTVDLDGTIIESVFDWFFVEYEQLTDFVLTDLPAQFVNCELTISVTATSGSPSIGVCKLGTVEEIGDTEYGAKVGIIDYSRKDTDSFGNTIVTERPYSKKVSLTVITELAAFKRIFRRLSALHATPAIYVGSEDSDYAPLIVYGFFKDFSIDVAYPTHHICSLEVEGLV